MPGLSLPMTDMPTTWTPQRLRELMEAMQADTQTTFAEALGVTQAYVSLLLGGTKVVQPGTTLEILLGRLGQEYLPADRRPDSRAHLR